MVVAEAESMAAVDTEGKCKRTKGGCESGPFFYMEMSAWFDFV
jgi:hypothetical protein